ncbi:hypothetical protein ACWFPY_34930 [Nocardia fluminea]
MVADTANHICHWSSQGAGYTQRRCDADPLPPADRYEPGVRADDALAADGVSIGITTMYDRTGPLRTCVVTSLSNADKLIDYTAPQR